MNATENRRCSGRWAQIALICLGVVVGLAATASPAWADSPTMAASQPTRLRITNNCPYPLWIQQDFVHPTTDPVVRAVKAGASLDYAIPDEGLAATRFWAKASCNSYGYDCAIGESTGVPAAQKAKQQTVSLFDPPIDSKFEATWGCLKATPSQCARNPSSPGGTGALDGWTWWNGSIVDGYTFPFEILAKTPGLKCYDQRSGAIIKDPSVRCGDLDPKLCPTKENLSTAGQYPVINGVNVTSVDLQLGAVSAAADLIGCLSPCTKLTQDARDGWRSKLGGLGPASAQAQMYCCPTPPVSAAACSAGPAASTQYLRSAQGPQKCGAYAYAYDDAQGLAKCEGPMQFEVIYCPSGKSLPLPPPRPPTPTAYCDPTAVPAQRCPGGKPCPNCGGKSCPCPP
jgi:hypothetical protein